MSNHLAHGIFDFENKNCKIILERKGIYGNLKPEEMLFWMERGALSVKCSDGIPLACQLIYSHIKLNHYVVFSYLKTLGFIILKEENGLRALSVALFFSEK